MKKSPLPTWDSIGLSQPGRIDANGDGSRGVTEDTVVTPPEARCALMRSRANGDPNGTGGPDEGTTTNPVPSGGAEHHQRCVSELLYCSVNDLNEKDREKDPRDELFESDEYQVLNEKDMKRMTDS